MNQRPLLIARIALLVILLALIRTIGELFRLQYVAATELTFTAMKPFLIAALLTAVSLMAMLLLYFFARYTWVSVLAALTIVGMLLIKFYLL